MSEIEFNAERREMLQKMQSFSNSAQSGSASGMVGWLMKKGIVSSEAAGQKVLFGLVVLNFILTILVIMYFI